MNLKRFHDAQNSRTGYKQAEREIQAGRKTSHWIWYIFPQLKSLGVSQNAKFYGISDMNEACSYLKDPVLFKRYAHMVQLIEQQLTHIPLDTLMGGNTDAKKLTSSLTLFRAAAAHLSSTGQDTNQNFKRLETRCDRIFSLISSQSYFPCRSTLNILQNARQTVRDEERVTAPIPRAITTAPSFDYSSIIAELAEYKKIRKNEWAFHFNFLGIISALYFIQDLVSGSDHFNTKNREVKLSAASKLQKIMNSTHTEIEVLTEAEKKALCDGRLGTIVNKHGGLTHLLQNAPEIQANDRFSNTGFRL